MDSIYNSFLDAFSLEKMDVPMILVGAVLIFLLYKGLEKVLFAPYLEHVELRESVTAGAVETAAMMRQKSLALRARYEEALLHARIAATKERVSLISDAQEKAATIINRAEQDAAKITAEARAKISRQIEENRQKLEPEAAILAEQLAARVDTELTVH